MSPEQREAAHEAADEAHVLAGAASLAEHAEWKAAVRALRAWERTTALSTQGRARLAYYLSRSGAPDEATEIYRGLIDQEPTVAKWQFGLAYQFQLQDRWKEAIDVYEAVMALAPRWVRVYRRYAEACVGAKLNDKAFDIAQRGIKAYQELSASQRSRLGVDHAKLCACAGRLLLQKSGRRGESSRALELFRDSVASDPLNPDAWYRLGGLHLEGGNFDEALRCLEQAHRLNRKKEYIIHRLAQVHLRKGDARVALTVYERIPAHRRTPYILHGIAVCHKALGCLEEAARMLYRAIQRERDKFYHYWEFGLVLAELGATKQAVEALEKANELFRREYREDYKKAEAKITELRSVRDEAKRIVFEEPPKDISQLNAGSVSRYDEKRGFGFIRDEADGERIFFHITNFKERVSPRIGARVRYFREKGPKGLQATKVSFV